MLKQAVHIFIVLSFIALVGCGNSTEENEPVTNVLYDNPQQGVRVQGADGWTIEKETATSVKFKNEKVVAIISVIAKGETAEEIKQGLLTSAGNVTVTDEGPNYISWKSKRTESIHTNVYINEKEDRNIITTFLTPNDVYETNKEIIEAFRLSVELY